MRREPKEGLNGLGRWKPRETEWLWKLGIGMGMGWWLDGDCRKIGGLWEGGCIGCQWC